MSTDECFDHVRNNLGDIKDWESDTSLNYEDLTTHCSNCINNVLTDDSKIVFTALKLRNFLLKNMSCLYDLPNYEKEENISTLNKMETTVAVLKMRKSDKTVPRYKALFPYNKIYAREKFPADTLIANEDKAYNLVCNGTVVNIEPFPIYIVWRKYSMKRV